MSSIKYFIDLSGQINNNFDYPKKSTSTCLFLQQPYQYVISMVGTPYILPKTLSGQCVCIRAFQNVFIYILVSVKPFHSDRPHPDVYTTLLCIPQRINDYVKPENGIIPYEYHWNSLLIPPKTPRQILIE